jgi:hypothetical protein
MNAPIPENPTTVPVRNLRVLTLIGSIWSLILIVSNLFSARNSYGGEALEGVWFLVTVVLAIGFSAILPFWFIWFLLKKVSQRKNWARITYLILTILGLAMTVPTWLKNFGSSTLSTLFGIALACLNIKNTFSLFSEASNVWFKSSDELSQRTEAPQVD